MRRLDKEVALSLYRKQVLATISIQNECHRVKRVIKVVSMVLIVVNIKPVNKYKGDAELDSHI